MRLIWILLPLLVFSADIVPLHPVKYNRQKALLGKKLFKDPILSKDKKVSCFSCHRFNEGGAEHIQFSKGVFGRIDAPMNSLSVYNLPYNIAFFWNGRAENLKTQAIMAMTDHNEFDMTPKDIEKRLNAKYEYVKMFKKIYHKEQITIDMITDVLTEFEKSLITLNSKFDLYLQNKTQLTKNELEGYKLFKRYGCIVCHNGINVGSNSYQKIGVVIESYNIPRGLDRAKVTNDKDDEYVYKVPSLRNIELTYPYFHDGSVKTLNEAIKKMAYYNLGIELNDCDAKKIEAFLKTLTGKKPKILDEE